CKEYDEVRKLGPMGGGMFGGQPGGPQGAPGGFSFTFDDGNVGDILGNLFQRGRRRGGGAASGVGPRRGDDLEAELSMSFQDAVNGVSTALYLTSDAACSTCHGSGAKPGTTPHTCPICQGRGVVD